MSNLENPGGQSDASVTSSFEGYHVHIGRPTNNDPYQVEITNPKTETNIELGLGELTDQDVQSLSTELRTIIPDSREADGAINIQKLRVAITKHLNPPLQ